MGQNVKFVSKVCTYCGFLKLMPEHQDVCFTCYCWIRGMKEQTYRDAMVKIGRIIYLPPSHSE